MAKITSVKDKEVIIKPGYKIKANGTFNIEDLYIELYQWFVHMGYAWKELEYKVTVKPGGVQSLELLWEGRKKIDDYSTFVIPLNLWASVVDVEVQLETGAKVKRQKGTLEFRSGAWILRSIEVWENRLMGNVVARFYEILIRERLLEQETQLYGEAHKLYDELKAFMMIHR